MLIMHDDLILVNNKIVPRREYDNRIDYVTFPGDEFRTVLEFKNNDLYRMWRESIYNDGNSHYDEIYYNHIDFDAKSKGVKNKDNEYDNRTEYVMFPGDEFRTILEYSNNEVFRMWRSSIYDDGRQCFDEIFYKLQCKPYMEIRDLRQRLDKWNDDDFILEMAKKIKKQRLEELKQI